jgi:hypothetical protein
VSSVFPRSISGAPYDVPVDKIRVRARLPVLGLYPGDEADVWPTRRIEVLIEGGQLELMGVETWPEVP